MARTDRWLRRFVSYDPPGLSDLCLSFLGTLVQRTAPAWLLVPYSAASCVGSSPSPCQSPAASSADPSYAHYAAGVIDLGQCHQFMRLRSRMVDRVGLAWHGISRRP